MGWLARGHTALDNAAARIRAQVSGSTLSPRHAVWVEPVPVSGPRKRITGSWRSATHSTGLESGNFPASRPSQQGTCSQHVRTVTRAVAAGTEGSQLPGPLPHGGLCSKLRMSFPLQGPRR